MKMLFLVGLLLFGRAAEATSYKAMVCEWDTNYVNAWDGDMAVTKSNQFFGGAQSIHDNGREDRVWKYRYCRPVGDSSPFSGTNSLTITDFDATWTRSCGGNSAISGANSYHDNGKEDRRWTYTCANFKSAYTLVDCAYSTDLNSWDGALDYTCPSDGVVRSIWSQHDNGREDRLWRFECCRVAASWAVEPKTCYWDSNYVNNWDGALDVQKSAPDDMFAGMYSVHDNGAEDRRFKFKYCRPETNADAIDSTRVLTETDWDATWTRSCLSTEAIVGLSSYHDNGKEDRRWKVTCGTLDKDFWLTSCSWTQNVNSWDGVVNYECPSNGVLRGITSQHDNGKEDRLWKFQCCTLDRATWTITNVVGDWVPLASCPGCASTTYTKTQGVQRDEGREVSDSYTASLETSITAGYDFLIGVSASTTVTSGFAATTTDTISSSLSLTYSESTTFTCAKSYFYQWQMQGTESLATFTGSFAVYSVQYLCTNDKDPQCPAGFCKNADCTTCDLFTGAQASPAMQLPEGEAVAVPEVVHGYQPEPEMPMVWKKQAPLPKGMPVDVDAPPAQVWHNNHRAPDTRYFKGPGASPQQPIPVYSAPSADGSSWESWFGSVLGYEWTVWVSVACVAFVVTNICLWTFIGMKIWNGRKNRVSAGKGGVAMHNYAHTSLRQDEEAL